MYIKEIKINGFKSFADNVNLELNRNFTGIVGPNGSGKSNIVDALKWVMGEQSVKTLRGSNNMSDVIFNGSNSREASRSAKVEIVLDNTDKSLPLDYTEIEIKRVLYKTGENEYFINKEKVRLKDITDLFLDSFSSKESLSIIPQGKISEILGGNPIEKRTVIEEAAGVLKYKKRKEETLRKLAKTNENIERVNMIIDELALQVEPLKEQAEKASIYKEKKARLESIEVSVLATDIAKYNEEYTTTKEEKASLELSLASEMTKDTEEKTLIEQLKLERTSLDNEISDLQRTLLSKTEELTSLNSKKELLKERDKYDKNSDEVKLRITYLEEEKLSLTSELSKLRVALEEDNRQLEVSTNRLNELNNDYKKAKIDSSSVSEDISKLTKRKYELTNKKDILEYNIDNMTKVPYGVKSVVSNPSLKGIKGTIGSIINIKSEYYDAIDVSLGGAVNYVITENDNDAKMAIEYLKRNNKGRVTFFPLNLIKPKSIEPNVLNIVKRMQGFVSLASDLVEYDSGFYNIIMNQLGNIIVADNVANALSISKKISSRYRVVSLDGEIIHVGGSLTGGSKSKSSSGILDKTELDTVTKNLSITIKDIETNELKLKEINENITNLTDMIYKANLNVLNASEKQNNTTNKINELTTKLESVVLELNGIDKNNSNTELDTILKEYYEVESLKKALEETINNKITKRKELISELELKESTVKKYEAKTKESTDLLNGLSVKEAKLSVLLDNLLNRLNEEYGITYEKARNDFELDIDIEVARNEINEIKRILKTLGEVNLASIDEYDRVSKRFEFLTTQKSDLESSEKNLLEIINNMDDIMIDKFATTFKKVNIEFTKVFKDLFGGGNAYLVMTEPTNVLETGIDIIANPPGKRPGSLSLLSGGEKTLTAISLLFAIMNLKDVPFVILDEVESALDEINVEKFGEYIKHYKGKTQLLVITHKKKTMEFLDLLYGITMQESGVSKLVSVKLEDIKE